MTKLSETLREICEIFSENNIVFVLTRFNRQNKILPNDLDLLVKAKDLGRTIKAFEANDYAISSHDVALGGRIPGMQKNLTKSSRIKIDLHQHFTWRKTRYFSLNLIWENLEKTKINGVALYVPKIYHDVFIVLVNIIFEKTYITLNDFDHIKKHLSGVFSNATFGNEAKKYGWLRTYKGFILWWETRASRMESFPVFLPVSLIIFSYLEKLLHDKKLDVVSLLYYFFFRIRYLLNKTIPYG